MSLGTPFYNLNSHPIIKNAALIFKLTSFHSNSTHLNNFTLVGFWGFGVLGFWV